MRDSKSVTPYSCSGDVLIVCHFNSNRTGCEPTKILNGIHRFSRRGYTLPDSAIKTSLQNKPHLDHHSKDHVTTGCGLASSSNLSTPCRKFMSKHPFRVPLLASNSNTKSVKAASISDQLFHPLDQLLFRKSKLYNGKCTFMLPS